MDKITFVNGQEPALNDTNLNLLQDNIEQAIEEMGQEASDELNNKIKYGTSLPATAEEGTIFILYDN